MRDIIIDFRRWWTLHKGPKLLSKVYSGRTLSQTHRSPHTAGISIATLAACLLVSILVFQGEAFRIKRQLLIETRIPNEIMEQWLSSKGYKKSQLTTPLEGVEGMKLSDLWLHSSKNWVILGGEIYSSPLCNLMAPLPNTPGNWGLVEPSIALWLEWIQNWKLTPMDPLNKKAGIGKNSKPDPRELRF